MSVESIRLLNGMDASVDDAAMVATSNAPEDGALSRQASIYFRPSVEVPHDFSKV